jgi:O-methyltransferase involved in polyketide biosynthesis
MQKHKDISVTAFIVNESRARLESLSGDRYAKFWVTEETKHLWEELEEEVYPYDHINLSLRNRFYLERIREFVNEHNDSVFVNMAAGFTSYPFLINTPCRCIETDYPHIINFKKEKVEQWQQDGIFPERSVEFYPLDMENPGQLQDFEKSIAAWCAEKPTIVIMEGITYYLSTGTIERLFSYYAKYLVEGSLVVCDFWGPDSNDYPVIQRVRKYLSRVSRGPVKPFTYIDINYFREIRGFSVVEHKDIAELELQYAESRLLQEKANRFPTEFVILEKN